MTAAFSKARNQRAPIPFVTMRHGFRKIPPARWTYRFIKLALLYAKFIGDFFHFKAMNQSSRFPMKWSDRVPMLDDHGATTSFDAHYLYHMAWAARILAQTRPSVHFDFSSHVHFNALVSAFVPIRFFEYRPANIRLSGLQCEAADLLSLPFAEKEIVSASCMHVMEHIGLGRYGDPLDPDGDRKAMRELIRVLAPRGNLMFVVPIGKPHIEFNAHRVYDHFQILDDFKALTLKDFSVIPETPPDAGLVNHPTPDLLRRQSLACGCYWFVKPE